MGLSDETPVADRALETVGDEVDQKVKGWRQLLGRFARKSTVPEALPFRALFGYLAGVSKSDALSYARAQAEAALEFPEEAWLWAEPYLEGHAWEVHEAGPGRSYLASILKLVKSTGLSKLYLFGGLRATLIEVDALGGLSSAWLPESETKPTTEGLTPGHKMAPFQPNSMGWLYVGGMMALMGVIAMALGMGAALLVKARETPHPQVFVTVPSVLPISQWNMALQQAKQFPGQSLGALRYVAGNWKVESMMASPGVPPPAAGLSPPPGKLPPGTPFPTPHLPPGVAAHPGAHPVPLRRTP